MLIDWIFQWFDLYLVRGSVRIDWAIQLDNVI
jgi:hypothetical protein